MDMLLKTNYSIKRNEIAKCLLKLNNLNNHYYLA